LVPSSSNQKCKFPNDFCRLKDLHPFVFLGRRADRCKVLFWDRGGFVLYYKRLERSRFRLPQVATDAASVTMDATELAMLLDGIDVVAVKRPRRWEPPRLASTPPAP
jgi:transposase